MLNVYLNGDLFYITFTINENINGESVLNVSYNQEDTFNEDWNDVSLDCEEIRINISESSDNPDIPSTPPEEDDKTTTVFSDTIIMQNENNLSVPVYIKNNHGIMGYKLFFEFDNEVLNFISVSSSGINGIFDYNLSDDGKMVSVVWNSSDDYGLDGLLFKINFEIIEKSDTNIYMDYSPDDTFNSDWDDVILVCNNIVLKAKSNSIIVSKKDSYSVIDGKFVYGLNAGMKSLDSDLEVVDGYELKYDMIHTIGTGTVIKATKDGAVSESYTIIIFGDVNGDGWYDGMDAMIVKCIAAGMLSKDDVGEAVWIAADCNHDGVIDDSDVELLEQAGVLLANVDQSKNNEELLETSSVYNEYLNLIDQRVESEEDSSTNEIVDLGFNNNLFEAIIEFVKYFIGLIKSVFINIL